MAAAQGLELFEGLRHFARPFPQCGGRLPENVEGVAIVQEGQHGPNIFLGLLGGCGSGIGEIGQGQILLPTRERTSGFRSQTSGRHG